MNHTPGMRSQRVLVVVALMMFLLSACAANGPSARTITVIGSGQVTGQPDTAIVTFVMWSKDEDANKAILNSKSKLAEVMAAITALGVDEKDIQPLSSQINPALGSTDGTDLTDFFRSIIRSHSFHPLTQKTNLLKKKWQVEGNLPPATFHLSPCWRLSLLLLK